MEKIVITQFTDPMMGLSWECEPMLCQLQERYGGRLELRDVMGVLVRDVSDFMTPEERALPEAEDIARYNDRLAQIYLDEAPIGGVPMNMEGFALFAPDRRSSLPLCLAYEAAKLVDPDHAHQFLHRLRQATVQECRATTREDEILRVVRLCGMSEHAFLELFKGPSAQAALEEDLHFKESLRIWSLPAFLVQCGDNALLLRGVPRYEDLVQAIECVMR